MSDKTIELVVVKQEHELQEDVPSFGSPETQQVDAETDPLGLILPIKFEPDTDECSVKQEIDIGPTELYKPLSFPAPQFGEQVNTEIVQSDDVALSHENSHPPRIAIKKLTELQDSQNYLSPIHAKKKPYACKGTIKKQARKLIYDVYRYMSMESNKGAQNINQILRRTAEATNTSYNKVKKIVEEGNTEESFKTIGKKREAPKQVLDEFEQSIVKRGIHTFHRKYKDLPTIKKLLLKLHEDLNYQGCETSLKTITNSLGFQLRKTESNKKVLIEKHSVRLKRIEYLQAIRKYRKEGRPIIYTDRLYVHASHVISKSQYGGTLLEINQLIPKEQSAVIVHAGSETGFVSNALLTLKSESKAGDYHGDFNVNKYEKWLKSQLIPNLPPTAVVVVDDASYYNKKYVALCSTSKKSEMKSWLKEKGIHFDKQMLKPQLYHLIKSNNAGVKKYSIDKILAQHNHDVLRLPPNHSDFNPFKMVWADMKGSISSKNIDGNIDCIIELVKEKVDAIEPDEWQKLCEKVIKLEEEYVLSDNVVDDLTEQLLISNDNDSDSGSDIVTDSDEST